MRAIKEPCPLRAFGVDHSLTTSWPSGILKGFNFEVVERLAVLDSFSLEELACQIRCEVRIVVLVRSGQTYDGHFCKRRNAIEYAIPYQV